MKSFLYDVRRIVKSFNGVEYASYSMSSPTPREKVFAPIVVNNEVKRVNMNTGEISDYKLSDFERSKRVSVQRSLRKFEDIATANLKDWAFFGTLTFSSQLVNRYDDDAVYHCFDLWRKYMKREYPFIKYLVVPERHKDKALHFHLMLGCCSENDLQLVPLKRLDNAGRIIYRCDSFKYGRNNFSHIEDIEKTINYCKKYIEKDLGNSTARNKRRFYYSKNCLKPVVTSEIVGKIADKKQLKNYVDSKYEDNLFISDYYVSANKDFIIKKIIK